MSLKLGNLKIIKKSTTQEVNNKINEEVNVKDTKLSKLEDTYTLVQKGNMSNRDFQKTLMRTQPKLLTPISDITRISLNKKIKELMNWYISIKKILMTIDLTKPLNVSDINYTKQKKFYSDLKELELFTNSERFDKRQSELVKSILEQLINDDLLKPIYSVSDKLIEFLIKTNRNTSFIKEIALCFGLYRKYISRLAENFSNDINNDAQIYFKTIDEVQPRFNMIFEHIKTCNHIYGNTRELNINTIIDQKDLSSINKELITTSEVSNLGLKKRLIEINKWLNNGLIHTQYSFNRLNNLKIRRNKRNMSKTFETPITNNYMVWCLLKDIESFMASIEDLLNGKSFLIGLNNIDTLEVLDVTY